MLTAILKTFFSLVQKEGGFPGGSDGKESACNVVDLGSFPRLGRSPGEGKDYLPTPVFWPREFHELYGSWGRKELNTTEQLSVFLQKVQRD